MEEENKQKELQFNEKDFKFKFKKITDFLNISENKCNVCQLKLKRFYPDCAEDGVQPIICLGCNQKAHLYCHGLDTQIMKEKLKDGHIICYFVCQKCREEPKKQIQCGICNQKQGILKRLKNSKNDWVHIICGMYAPQNIKVTSYRSIEFELIKPLIKDQDADSHPCQICNSSCCTISCQQQDCSNYAHLYCVMNNSSSEDDEEQQSNDEWCFKLLQYKNDQFDIVLNYNPEIAKRLDDSLNQLGEALNLIHKKPVDSNQTGKIEGEGVSLQQDNSSQQLSRNNKRQRKPIKKYQSEEMEPEDEANQKSIDPTLSIQQNQQQIIQSEYDDNPEWTQIKRTVIQEICQKIELENDAKKNCVNRGGSIYIECRHHKTDDIYCICLKCDNGAMIACDCCLDWYHFDCLKINRDKLKEDCDYRCAFCDEWYKHKEKKLLKEIANDKFENYDILPKICPKFSIMDYIFLMIVVDQRISNLLKYRKFNIIDNLDQIKATLKKLPLISTQTDNITKNFYKQYLAQAFEQAFDLYQAGASPLKIHSVLTLVSPEEQQQIEMEEQIEEEGQESKLYKNLKIDQTTLAKNQEVVRLIDQIEQLFIQEIIPFRGTFSKLKRQHEWIEKIVKKITSKEKMTQLQAEELLHEQEKEPYQFFEKVWLQQQLDSAVNWQHEVSQYFEMKIKESDKIEQEEEDLITHWRDKKKQIISEEEFIKKKMQNRREKLKLKTQYNDFERLIKLGRQLNLEMASDIKNLEQQITVAQDWIKNFEQNVKTKSDLEDSYQKMMQNFSICSPEMYQVIDQMEALEIWMCYYNDIKNRIEGNTIGFEEEDNEKIDQEVYHENEEGYDEDGGKKLFDIEEKKKKSSSKMDQEYNPIISQFQSSSQSKNKANQQRLNKNIENNQNNNNTFNLNQNRIEIEELDQLLEKSKQFTIQLEEVNYLQVKLMEIRHVQEDLKNFLEEEYDDQQYKKKKEQLMKFPFKLPEIDIFFSKMNVYKEIQQSFSKKTPLETLVNYTKLAQQQKLGDSIVKQLDEKISRANDILKRLKILIESKQINDTDLAELEKWQQQLKKDKIGVKKENDQIKLIFRAHKWFKNVFLMLDGLQKNNMANQQNQQQLQQDQGSSTQFLSNLNIQEIYTYIKERFDVFEKQIDQNPDIISQLIKEGKSIEIFDIRIKDIFNQISSIIWRYDVIKLLEKKEDLSSSDVEQLYSASQTYQIDQQDALYQQLNQIHSTWKNWRIDFESYFGIPDFYKLLDDNNKHDEVAIKIDELIKRSQENVKISLKNDIQQLKLRKIHLDWAKQSYNEYIIFKQQGVKITKTFLQEMLEKSKIINYSEQSAVYIQMQNDLQTINQFAKEYEIYCKKKSNMQEMFRSYTAKLGRSQQCEKQSEKVSLEKAINLKQQLENSPFYFSQHIQDISRDIDKTNQIVAECNDLMSQNTILYKKIQQSDNLETFNTLESYSDNQNKYKLVISFESGQQFTKEKADQLNEKLKKLRQSLVKETPLHVTHLQDRLYIFEIELQAIMHLNRYKQSNIEKWRKIIKFVKDTESDRLLQSEWYKDFIQEEKIATEILHRIEEIREKERDLNRTLQGQILKREELRQRRANLCTLSQVVEVNSLFINCLIQFEEEKKYVADLIAKSKSILDRFKALYQIADFQDNNLEKPFQFQISNSLKINSQDLQSFADRLKRNPIRLIEVEEQVELDIQIFGQIKKKMEEYEQRKISDDNLPSILEYKIAQEIVELYEKHPHSKVFHKGASELAKQQADAIEIVDALSKELELMGHDYVSLDDFQKMCVIFDRVSPRFKYGSTYFELQVKMWLRSIEYINSATENEYTFTFHHIKSLLAEGYQILFRNIDSQENLDKLRSPIDYLENLVLNVEKFLIEYSQTSLNNSGNLSNVSNNSNSVIYGKIVDISDIIIEHKLALQYNKHSKLAIETVVKNAYKDLKLFKRKMQQEKEGKQITQIPHEQQKQDQFDNKSSVKKSSQHIGQNQQSSGSKQQQQQGEAHQKIKLINKQNNQVQQATQKPKLQLVNANKDMQNQQGNSQDIYNRGEGKRQIIRKTGTEDFVYDTNIFKNQQKKEKQDQDSSNMDLENEQQNQRDEVNKTSSSSESSTSDLENMGVGLKKKQKPKNQQSGNVEEEDRLEGRKQLLKVISKNPIFAKQKDSHLKAIENQLFGDYVKDKQAYQNKIKMYKKLFKALVNYQLISKKLLSKNFEQSKLENLYKKINSLEGVEQSLKNQQAKISSQTQQQYQQSEKQFQGDQGSFQYQPLLSGSKKFGIDNANEPSISKKVKVDSYNPLSQTPPQQQGSSINIPSIGPLTFPASLQQNQKQQLEKKQDFFQDLLQDSKDSISKQINEKQQSSFLSLLTTGQSQNLPVINAPNIQSSSQDKHYFGGRNQGSNSGRYNNQKVTQGKHGSRRSSSSSSRSTSYERKHGYHHKGSKHYNQSRSGQASHSTNQQQYRTGSQGSGHGSSSRHQDKAQGQKEDKLAFSDDNESDHGEGKKIKNRANSGSSTSNIQQYNLDVNTLNKQQQTQPLQNLSSSMNKMINEQDNSNQKNEEMAENLLQTLQEQSAQLQYQQSITAPILFDPDQELEEEEKRKQKEEELKKPDYPVGSVFRIVNQVRVRLGKTKSKYLKFVIYSTEDIKSIKKFPKIEIVGDQKPGMQSANIVFPYYEKNEHKGEILVLRGWAELVDPLPDAQDLNLIIQEQDKNNDVYGLKLNNQVLNIATFNQLKKYPRLMPKVQDQQQSNNSPKMAVLLYIKKDILNKELKEYIDPEFISLPLPPQQSTFLGGLNTSNKEGNKQEQLANSAYSNQNIDDLNTSGNINKLSQISKQNKPNQKLINQQQQQQQQPDEYSPITSDEEQQQLLQQSDSGKKKIYNNQDTQKSTVISLNYQDINQQQSLSGPTQHNSQGLSLQDIGISGTSQMKQTGISQLPFQSQQQPPLINLQLQQPFQTQPSSNQLLQQIKPNQIMPQQQMQSPQQQQNLFYIMDQNKSINDPIKQNVNDLQQQPTNDAQQSTQQNQQGSDQFQTQQQNSQPNILSMIPNENEKNISDDNMIDEGQDIDKLLDNVMANVELKSLIEHLESDTNSISNNQQLASIQNGSNSIQSQQNKQNLTQGEQFLVNMQKLNPHIVPESPPNQANQQQQQQLPPPQQIPQIMPQQQNIQQQQNLQMNFNQTVPFQQMQQQIHYQPHQNPNQRHGHGRQQQNPNSYYQHRQQHQQQQNYQHYMPGMQQQEGQQFNYQKQITPNKQQYYQGQGHNNQTHGYHPHMNMHGNNYNQRYQQSHQQQQQHQQHQQQMPDFSQHQDPRYNRQQLDNANQQYQGGFNNNNKQQQDDNKY